MKAEKKYHVKRLHLMKIYAVYMDQLPEAGQFNRMMAMVSEEKRKKSGPIQISRGCQQDADRGSAGEAHHQ